MQSSNLLTLLDGGTAIDRYSSKVGAYLSEEQKMNVNAEQC